jgi:hypothetical protein
MPVIDARTVPPDQLEEAWTLYAKRFTPLAERAAQRHLLDREEFDQICADKRVTKFRAYDGAGRLIGLSTLTNDLDSMQDVISVPFFARRWPDEYREGRIWYVGFVCAAQSNEGRAFAELLLAMNEVRMTNDGISFQDYCTRNALLPTRAIEALARAGHRMMTEVVDQQSYYLLRPAGRVSA